MSQLVKTKRQANFKDFKRFGAFKGLVEQKNVVSIVCKLGLFYVTRLKWHSRLIMAIYKNFIKKYSSHLQKIY
jgi:hypothetical protein